MAFVFRIKRRLAGEAGPPPLSSVMGGELMFNEVDNTLYYARESSNTIITVNPTLSGNTF